MPAPSGIVEGGHAIFVFGYDDGVGPGGAALIRNSWGRSWGINGNAWFRWRYLLPAVHDAWSTADLKGNA